MLLRAEEECVVAEWRAAEERVKEEAERLVREELECLERECLEREERERLAVAETRERARQEFKELRRVKAAKEDTANYTPLVRSKNRCMPSKDNSVMVKTEKQMRSLLNEMTKKMENYLHKFAIFPYRATKCYHR